MPVPGGRNLKDQSVSQLIHPQVQINLKDLLGSPILRSSDQVVDLKTKHMRFIEKIKYRNSKKAEIVPG